MPGISPRRDELDDFLTSAGDAARFKLATLELRRTELGGKPGDEGIRGGSEEILGEFRLGDCGSGVFAAVCSERRFSECERRCASLFVDCRAAFGVLSLAACAGGCCEVCISAVASRGAAGCLVCAGNVSVVVFGW